MPIKPCPYFDPNEPSNDAEVRRYLTMFKFQKLMANEELYFARPDGFEDNDSAEEINVGKVTYGKDKLARPGNVWCEITSKTEDFTWESEIRAMLNCPSVLS